MADISTLEVEVFSCADLKNTAYLLKQAPYVKVVPLPGGAGGVSTQPCIDGHLNPVFDAVHGNVLLVALGPMDMSLQVEVHAQGTLADTLIGKAEVDVGQALSKRKPMALVIDTGGTVLLHVRQPAPAALGGGSGGAGSSSSSSSSSSSNNNINNPLRRDGGRGDAVAAVGRQRLREGQLVVAIHGAKCLRNVQLLGRQDPYVIAVTLPSNSSFACTRSVLNGDTEPAWGAEHGNTLELEPLTALAAPDGGGGGDGDGGDGAETIEREGDDTLLLEVWNANTIVDDLIGRYLLVLSPYSTDLLPTHSRLVSLSLLYLFAARRSSSRISRRRRAARGSRWTRGACWTAPCCTSHRARDRRRSARRRRPPRRRRRRRRTPAAAPPPWRARRSPSPCTARWS